MGISLKGFGNASNSAAGPSISGMSMLPPAAAEVRLPAPPVVGGWTEAHTSSTFDPTTINRLAWIGSLSPNNFTFTHISGSWAEAWGTNFITSGKWYWEVKFDVGPNMMAGVVAAEHVDNPFYTGSDIWSQGMQAAVGLYPGASTPTGGYDATWAVGQIVGLGLDADALTLSYYDVSGSRGVAFSNISLGSGLYPAVAVHGSSVATINFGATAFTYPIPAGYNGT